MSVRWNSSTSRFCLSFTGREDCAGMNAHSLVKDQMENHLNANRNLALTAKILTETMAPLK